MPQQLAGSLFKIDIKYFLPNKPSISNNLGYKIEGYAMSYFLKEGAIFNLFIKYSYDFVILCIFFKCLTDQLMLNYCLCLR